MAGRPKLRSDAITARARLSAASARTIALAAVKNVWADLIDVKAGTGADARALLRATQRAAIQELISHYCKTEIRGQAQRGKPALLQGLGVPADALIDHHAIGTVYEAMLSLHPRLDARGRLTVDEGPGHARKASGSYYTPPETVERLLDLVLMPCIEDSIRRRGEAGILDLRICDPSCGTGNFVIAAAKRLGRALAALRCGHAAPSPREDARSLRDVVMQCIYAIDIDGVCVEACRGLLSAIGGGSRPLARVLELHVQCADALTTDWGDRFPEVFDAQGGFDVVIGNPPFLNQLETTTTHDRTRAAHLTTRFGSAAAAYTDPSALFLLQSVRIARHGKGGGRIALIQPQSVMAARDRAAARSESLADCSLESLWIAGERVFDAGVLVCCPILRREGPRKSRVSLYRGRDIVSIGRIPIDCDALRKAPTWSPLAAAAIGVPSLEVPHHRTLSDIATATADFRDQFYGLKGCVVEDDEVDAAHKSAFPPLLTTGLIDAATNRWGTRPTRFAGTPFAAPRVDLAKLERDPSLARWAKSRLVAKVLLATQTRVLEAVVDSEGAWIPAVPVITIVPRQPRLVWHTAAVLLSPVATVWAVREYGGCGLSATAIKLSAKQALQIPIPTARGRKYWTQAARRIALAHRAEGDASRLRELHAAAELMVQAYGLTKREGAAVLEWWKASANRPFPRRQAQIRSL